MKLCILGPVNTVDRTLKIVRQTYNDIESFAVSYNVYTEALELVEKMQQEADAILFPGKASYLLCEKNIVPTVPWEFIPRHVSSLHRTMLELQFKYNCGLNNISYDTLSRELILSAYAEFGVKEQNTHFYLAEQRILDPDYLSYLLKFHMDNYLHNGASCCITGLTEIGNALKQRSIPYAITLPSSTLIADTVQKLKLRYESSLNMHNWIVVIMIKITYSGNYSTLTNDQYRYITNRIKVLENIYNYSYRIDGVVVEEGNDGFLIFTTKHVLELETAYFKNFYLLEMFDSSHVENVAAGIGCGRTAAESKANANAALEMSKKEKANCAYVISENGAISKPIYASHKSELREVGNNLSLLSKKAKLSSNTLHVIWRNTQLSKLEEFTSKQIAALCGFSIRTTDRILKKLVEAGCCSISGTYITTGHGRPSRTFRFYWDKFL